MSFWKEVVLGKPLLNGRVSRNAKRIWIPVCATRSSCSRSPKLRSQRCLSPSAPMWRFSDVISVRGTQPAVIETNDRPVQVSRRVVVGADGLRVSRFRRGVEPCGEQCAEVPARDALGEGDELRRG